MSTPIKDDLQRWMTLPKTAPGQITLTGASRAHAPSLPEVEAWGQPVRRGRENAQRAQRSRPREFKDQSMHRDRLAPLQRGPLAH